MASSVVTMKMNAAMERALRAYGADMASAVVGVLSDAYGFDVDEALTKINLEKMVVTKRGDGKAKRAPRKSKARKDDDSASVASNASRKVEKPSVPLPFVGTVKEEWCKGIRPNYGLYGQCTNAPLSDSAHYCKTCQGQADKTPNGKPKCGDIRDRAEFAGNQMEWVSADGKQVLPFVNVAEKRNIDIEVAKSEMNKFFGQDIPAEQMEKRVMKRGRKPSSKKESVEGGLLAQVKEEMKKAKKASQSDSASIASDGVDVSDAAKPSAVEVDLVQNLKEGKSIRAKPKAKKVSKKAASKPAPEPVEEAKSATPSPAPAPVEEEEEVKQVPPSPKVVPEMEVVDDEAGTEDDDDEGVEPNLKVAGVWYFKDEEGNVFDLEGEHIGIYDEEEEEIQRFEE
jgi:hypothetical protein